MTLKGLAKAWIETSSELEEAKLQLEQAKSRLGLANHKLACLSSDLVENCGEMRIIAIDEGYLLVRRSHGVELVPKEPAE